MLPPQLGTRLPLSSMYMAIVIMICFKLLVQVMLLARSRAFCSAGSSIAARIAMIAILLTSESIFFMSVYVIGVLGKV